MVRWLVASVELDMGTCGDGIREGRRVVRGGLFRNLGGQMDKLCPVGGWLARKDEQGMCVCMCVCAAVCHMNAVEHWGQCD